MFNIRQINDLAYEAFFVEGVYSRVNFFLKVFLRFNMDKEIVVLDVESETDVPILLLIVSIKKPAAAGFFISW